MYVAKVNDRGKASYAYMFDEQLYELDDLLSRSYYMKKSSDKQEIIEFCEDWNREHVEQIRENKIIYYIGVIIKGLLQAPALVVLYSSIIIGIMLIFGSEIFYEHIMESGVAAFGGSARTYAIVAYIVSAAIGLIASLSIYNNVWYKLIRSVFSIICFVLISPVFFEKVFFTNRIDIITITIIFIVGCFFIRFIVDRLLTNIIRKNTEIMIRAAHENIDTGSVAEINNKDIHDISIQPVMNRVRNREILKQHKR